MRFEMYAEHIEMRLRVTQHFRSATSIACTACLFNRRRRLGQHHCAHIGCRTFDGVCSAVCVVQSAAIQAFAKKLQKIDGRTLKGVKNGPGAVDTGSRNETVDLLGLNSRRFLDLRFCQLTAPK